MADIISKEERSRMMGRIRGKNTKPEIIVRKWLHARGLRFRLHRKDLPACPDIVIPSKKVAIFVHGCFWHQHEGCKNATIPATNTEFWKAKFAGTKERDAKARFNLERLGWNVLEVWECEIENDAFKEIISKKLEIPLPVKL